MHHQVPKFVCKLEIPERTAPNLVVGKNNRHCGAVPRKGIYNLRFDQVIDYTDAGGFQDFSYAQNRVHPAPSSNAGGNVLRQFLPRRGLLPLLLERLSAGSTALSATL